VVANARTGVGTGNVVADAAVRTNMLTGSTMGVVVDGGLVGCDEFCTSVQAPPVLSCRHARATPTGHVSPSTETGRKDQDTKLMLLIGAYAAFRANDSKSVCAPL